MFFVHLKYAHLFFVLISVVLFNVRFWWKANRVQRTLPRAFKFVPHLNDSLLLLTGMGLAHLYAQFKLPMGWLGIKIGLVLLYIVAGILAMRAPVRSKQAWCWYGLACVAVLCVVRVARCKVLI